MNVFTGDPTGDVIPNIFTPLGPLLCAPVHVAENVVDLLWHIDLTYPYTSPPVHYFLRIKYYNVVDYLFAFADDLDVVFNQIDPDIVAPLGCIFTNLFRALTQILDFSLGLHITSGSGALRNTP